MSSAERSRPTSADRDERAARERLRRESHRVQQELLDTHPQREALKDVQQVVFEQIVAVLDFYFGWAEKFTSRIRSEPGSLAREMAATVAFKSAGILATSSKWPARPAHGYPNQQQQIVLRRDELKQHAHYSWYMRGAQIEQRRSQREQRPSWGWSWVLSRLREIGVYVEDRSVFNWIGIAPGIEMVALRRNGSGSVYYTDGRTAEFPPADPKAWLPDPITTRVSREIPIEQQGIFGMKTFALEDGKIVERYASGEVRERP